VVVLIAASFRLEKDCSVKILERWRRKGKEVYTNKASTVVPDEASYCNKSADPNSKV